jgi:uncharacterized membrane protein
MIRAAHVVHVVALALWVGGLVALAAVAAPVIFKTAGSRHVAGTVFGGILRTFAWLEIALAVVSLAGFALSRPAGRLDWIRGACLAAMIVLLAGYAFGVNPALAAVRPQCGSFDRYPVTDSERAARERFNGLHRWSERLVGANILVGLALLALGAAKRT